MNFNLHYMARVILGLSEVTLVIKTRGIHIRFYHTLQIHTITSGTLSLCPITCIWHQNNQAKGLQIIKNAISDLCQINLVAKSRIGR